MTDGVRRLSHEEAEMLISARMDEYLDRADSRALLVHLQTCESCRAFAVQSEVLGRELATLPMLPPSALVDRQIRESISKGRSRWSRSSLMPATAGNSGLRMAVGALAMLTLVSVFLLVRMAGDNNGGGTAIDAPNGAVAQQFDSTASNDTVAVEETAGPTETARLVVPKTPEPGSTEVAAAVDATQAPTQAVVFAGETVTAKVEPTRTLDSSYVYSIDTTKTPSPGQAAATESPGEMAATATEEPGDISVASLPVDGDTPIAGGADENASATESPVPAETATVAANEQPVETPGVATDDVSGEPFATEAPASTEEPAATEELPTQVPPTETPEPTATATPVEISVAATQTAPEPTKAQPDGATEVIQVETPDGTKDTDPATSVPADDTATVPAEPYGQPTIAPISGQTGAEQDTGESPPIVASDSSDNQSGSSAIQNTGPSTGDNGQPGSGAQEANQGDDDGSSPPIVPSGGTGVPDGVGGDTGGSPYGGDAEVTSAVPTADDSLEPMGLDLSDTVAGLPSGTTSPLGRLEFSPGMNLYAVTAPDGALAVADLEGDLVVTFAGGDLPVWSGAGLMFSSPGNSGSRVGLWNSEDGTVSYIEQSSDSASDDVPIGGDGTAFYFLRIYPGNGIMELRSATIDGSDNGVIWTSDEYTLGGARPVYSESGIYLPTGSEWIFIDWSGEESSLGTNSYGFVGPPVLSPGGGLMAYSAGDQVVVAWTEAPGEAIATAPFDGAGGYAFATTGEEIVVTSGSGLVVISYEGDELGTLQGTQPVGSCYWISDTIYYVQIGEDAELKSTTLEIIQSG
ncbi:MAG: hypothetical protein E6R14_02890 [Thermomicrobiales bacterium]|nr:MAG: hypothetical protein E6R14_02890 [Thermomicrobiales bacterium]